MIVLTREIMSIVLKYIIILIINLIILKNCINDDNGEDDISKKAKKRWFCSYIKEHGFDHYI